MAAGESAGVPVMVDFGDFRPERPYRELVMRKLRPGDISTHMYLRAIDMLDEGGKVKSYFAEARGRGVIFDVGHGGGSFVFRLAVPAIKQGWTPDSISTDLHIDSMNAGMKDMLNVMSKFLNMGLSLEDVILRSTWNPAREIRHPEVGSLTVGATADVAVLRVEKGQFGYVDTDGLRMEGDRRLVCELTIRKGSVVWDLNGISRQDWRRFPSSDPNPDPRWDATLARHQH
jgi:dihydroorotase